MIVSGSYSPKSLLFLSITNPVLLKQQFDIVKSIQKPLKVLSEKRDRVYFILRLGLDALTQRVKQNLRMSFLQGLFDFVELKLEVY